MSLLSFFIARVVLALGIGVVVDLTIAADVVVVFYDETGYEDKPRGLYNFDTDTGEVTLRATIPEYYRFFGTAPPNEFGG